MAGNDSKRTERLKAALRDNLRKRKERARATEAETADPAARETPAAQEKNAPSSRS